MLAVRYGTRQASAAEVFLNYPAVRVLVTVEGIQVAGLAKDDQHVASL